MYRATTEGGHFFIIHVSNSFQIIDTYTARPLFCTGGEKMKNKDEIDKLLLQLTDFSLQLSRLMDTLNDIAETMSQLSIRITELSEDLEKAKEDAHRMRDKVWLLSQGRKR